MSILLLFILFNSENNLETKEEAGNDYSYIIPPPPASSPF